MAAAARTAAVRTAAVRAVAVKAATADGAAREGQRRGWRGWRGWRRWRGRHWGLLRRGGGGGKEGVDGFAAASRCGRLHAGVSPGETSGRARGRAAAFESDPGSNKRESGWEKPPTQSLPGCRARGKEQGCSAQQSGDTGAAIRGTSTVTCDRCEKGSDAQCSLAPDHLSLLPARAQQQRVFPLSERCVACAGRVNGGGHRIRGLRVQTRRSHPD